MFKKKVKFSDGAMMKKLRFAFKPTFIDGGAYKILFKFYYELYKREEGYLNWDKPDKFKSIGDFSKKGIVERFQNIKEKKPETHWIEEDKFKVGFMTSTQERENRIQ